MAEGKLQRRSFLIGVKVSEGERKAIDSAANAETISRAAFVRRAVIREISKSPVMKKGGDT